LDKAGMAIANKNQETVATLGTKPQDDDKQKKTHTHSTVQNTVD